MTNRDTALSASQEDYLEMIVRLIRDKGAARVRDIASRLSVAKSSVSIALRALSKRNLVHYKPYELVTLTEKGEVMADRILARHKTLSAFLITVLGMGRNEAEANACRLEHAVDEEVMLRLRRFVDFMESSDVPARELARAFCADMAIQTPAKADPPRPESADRSEPKGAAAAPPYTLADVRPGESAIIVKTSGSAASRLMDMGVTRGTKAKVIRVAPLGDPVEVDIRGYRLSLRKKEAQAIAVEKNSHA